TAWFIEVDQMRGLNDTGGFARGDALIHAAARLLEDACEPGVDFAGHVAGGRFVVLAQSEDWKARAERLIEAFPALVRARTSAGKASIRRSARAFQSSLCASTTKRPPATCPAKSTPGSHASSSSRAA